MPDVHVGVDDYGVPVLDINVSAGEDQAYLDRANKEIKRWAGLGSLMLMLVSMWMWLLMIMLLMLISMSQQTDKTWRLQADLDKCHQGDQGIGW